MINSSKISCLALMVTIAQLLNAAELAKKLPSKHEKLIAAEWTKLTAALHNCRDDELEEISKKLRAINAAIKSNEQRKSDALNFAAHAAPPEVRKIIFSYLKELKQQSFVCFGPRIGLAASSILGKNDKNEPVVISGENRVWGSDDDETQTCHQIALLKHGINGGITTLAERHVHELIEGSHSYGSRIQVGKAGDKTFAVMGTQEGNVSIVSDINAEQCCLRSISYTFAPSFASVRHGNFPISAVATGEDEQRKGFFVSGDVESIKVWDAQTQQPRTWQNGEITTLDSGHAPIQIFTCKNPQGVSFIVSHDVNGTLSAWRTETGERLWHDQGREAIQHSNITLGTDHLGKDDQGNPIGNPLLVVARDTNRCRVMDVQTGQIINSIPMTGFNQKPSAVALAYDKGRPLVLISHTSPQLRSKKEWVPDSPWWATYFFGWGGSGDFRETRERCNSMVHVWNLVANTTTKIVLDTNYSITALAGGSDKEGNPLCLIGDEKGHIKVLDVNIGKVKHQLSIEDGTPIESIAVSEDANNDLVIFASTVAGTQSVWTYETGEFEKARKAAADEKEKNSSCIVQ
ncbi:MAG TPA: hypothetical protein VHA13_01275 [Gammaproteobacteria bacterium]|nr:hypothetical protein [Gammaproteobacteria bacterium]